MLITYLALGPLIIGTLGFMFYYADDLGDGNVG